jgi:hypothetical protein
MIYGQNNAQRSISNLLECRIFCSGKTWDFTCDFDPQNDRIEFFHIKYHLCILELALECHLFWLNWIFELKVTDTTVPRGSLSRFDVLVT